MWHSCTRSIAPLEVKGSKGKECGILYQFNCPFGGLGVKWEKNNHLPVFGDIGSYVMQVEATQLQAATLSPAAILLQAATTRNMAAMWVSLWH